MCNIVLFLGDKLFIIIILVEYTLEQRIFLQASLMCSLLLLEIGSVIFSNISLVLRVFQCCVISVLLSSLVHVYGEFPSQIGITCCAV